MVAVVVCAESTPFESLDVLSVNASRADAGVPALTWQSTPVNALLLDDELESAVVYSVDDLRRQERGWKKVSAIRGANGCGAGNVCGSHLGV